MVLCAVVIACIIGASEEIIGKEFLSRETRDKLWPIYGKSENIRFVLLSLLMLLSLFVYSIIRIKKDSLVQYNPGSGAEVFNYLKFFVVLPFSILFVIAYTKISNRFKGLHFYLILLSIFTVFFTVFGFILNQGGSGSLLFGENGCLGNINIRGILHGSKESLIAAQNNIPLLAHLLPVIWYWSSSLFYAMSEIWGTVALSILTFQVANSITTRDEASRMYPMFGILGNFGMILGGHIVQMKLPFEYVMLYIVSACVLMGIIYIILFSYSSETSSSSPQKKKESLTVKESFQLVIRSKHLLYMAVIVFAYGISINLIEVTWKSQLKLYLPNRIEYDAFQGTFYQWTGAITMLLMFLSKGFMRKFGWRLSALITPIALLVTSTLFFVFTLFDVPSYLTFGLSPLYLSVFIGQIQNIVSKSGKYSFFDPTKEQYYKALKSEELKTKGKASVDVIGGRLGKSSGGVLQLFALFVYSFAYGIPATQINIALFLFVVMLIVVLLWIWAVIKLSNEYEKLSKE